MAISSCVYGNHHPVLSRYHPPQSLFTTHKHTHTHTHPYTRSFYIYSMIKYMFYKCRLRFTISFTSLFCATYFHVKSIKFLYILAWCEVFNDRTKLTYLLTNIYFIHMYMLMNKFYKCPQIKPQIKTYLYSK